MAINRLPETLDFLIKVSVNRGLSIKALGLLRSRVLSNKMKSPKVSTDLKDPKVSNNCNIKVIKQAPQKINGWII